MEESVDCSVCQLLRLHRRAFVNCECPFCGEWEFHNCGQVAEVVARNNPYDRLFSQTPEVASTVPETQPMEHNMCGCSSAGGCADCAIEVCPSSEPPSEWLDLALGRPVVLVEPYDCDTYAEAVIMEGRKSVREPIYVFDESYESDADSELSFDIQSERITELSC